MTDIEQLRTIFARGLALGIGRADGQVCIESAIALASGEGLTESPSCVDKADRNWAITINDAHWSSSKARAEALLPIALAQIGTAGTNRRAWVEAVAIGTVQRVLPIALRAAGLEAKARACEGVTTLRGAEVAARAGANAATRAAALAAANYAVRAAALAAASYAARASAAANAAHVAIAIADAAYADAAYAKAASARDAGLLVAVEVALAAYRAEGRC